MRDFELDWKGNREPVSFWFFFGFTGDWGLILFPVSRDIWVLSST